MRGPRLFATVVTVCGMVAFVGWEAPRLSFDSLTIQRFASPASAPDVTGSIKSFSVHPRSFVPPRETAKDMLAETATSAVAKTEPAAAGADAAPAETAVVEAPSLDSHPTLPPEQPVQLASASPSDGLKEYPKPDARPLETAKDCGLDLNCIDDYLWALYEKTPKLDTNKETEKVKKTVKKKGKLRTFFATITKYVLGDFTWKDPAAAEKVSMSMKDYVIGGMDRGFRLKLYRGLRAIEDAGFMPGITSAFRDDYRQGIATGNKAASDSSFHGGSRRGGYGHGLAADIVSLKGENRTERYASSDEMWKWIDAHEKELGIGRPYRDRDPPHVGAIDGKEFISKRAVATAQETKKTKRAQTATLQSKKKNQTTRDNPGAAKQVTPEKRSKVSSLQPR